MEKASGKMKVYYKQPKFYRNFHCIGGKCPYTCCGGGWGIIWTEEEIDKLRKADCSEQLKALIDSSFAPFEKNKYTIICNEENQCPFLTEDKLCIIQRELGEEYLSMTCHHYPRMGYISGDFVTRTCVSSCFEAFSLVCGKEDSMELVSGKTQVLLKENKSDSDLDIEKHPEVKYRNMMFDFFYELISDKSRSVENSIIHGAIAAKRLTECIKCGSIEHIPQLIKNLKAQLNDENYIQMLDNIKPNYKYKLGICSKIVEFAVNPVVVKPFYDDENKNVLNIEKYAASYQKFEEACSGKPFLLRNVALNMLFECSMPFFTLEKTLFENYSYYVAAFAAIKMTGAGVANFQGNTEYLFEGAVPYISRSLFQTLNKIDLMLNLLTAFKCTTPAALALLIK